MRIHRGLVSPIVKQNKKEYFDAYCDSDKILCQIGVSVTNYDHSIYRIRSFYLNSLI